MRITKDTLIGDILKMDMGMARILMQNGMGCVGCPASARESLGEACAVHRMDPEKVLSELNTYLDNPSTQPELRKTGTRAVISNIIQGS